MTLNAYAAGQELTSSELEVQEFLLGPVREQLAKAPAVSTDRDYKQVDAVVVSQFPDRLTKFQAPEMVQPSGRWAPSVALDRLLKNYGRPPLKAVSKGAFESMDGYQWVLAAAAHTERHTKQILEVKADPNFPAK